jgi:hypothetical protein
MSWIPTVVLVEFPSGAVKFIIELKKMALCKDPLRTYLNNLGYNVILLPRTGIEPLDVLGKDGGSIERLGTLAQMWSSSIAAPQVDPPQTALGINGQKTASLNLDVGLKFLSNVLGAMGALVPQLSFAYRNARKVEFSFTDVKVAGVDPLALGNHLAAGTLSSNNPFVRRYFEDDDTDAFIITEVLKSNSITAKAQTDDSAGVTVDLPAIQAAVGAKVAVTQNSSQTTELTYTGDQLLTFGHKVFQIEFSRGSWSIRGQKPSSDVAFLTPGMMEDDTQLADEEPIVFERMSVIR